MKTFKELGINERSDKKRTNCPLCEEPDSLTIIYEESGTHIFNCVNCSQAGSLATGWWDNKNIEKGYVPLDEAEVYDKVIEAFRNGFGHGVSTGWLSVDEFYTVRKGEITIITGTPNHGKSEFLDALGFKPS